LKGKRILIVQTVENRRAVWREFTRENCELYGVLELLPLLDNPNQPVRAARGDALRRSDHPTEVRPPTTVGSSTSVSATS
jgi:hypothetical protein